MKSNQELEFREPTAIYTVSPKRYKKVNKPSRKDFDACFKKLKSEADERFGQKDRMTVDEYFDKLGYIVDGLYARL